MRQITILLTAAALVFYAGGCANRTDPDLPGEVRILLVDGPGDFQAVNIAVERVEVNRTVGGRERWETIASEPATYDLLQLRNGVSAVLAGATLPAGDYSQIRLIVGRGSNVVVDDVSHPLTIPGGTSSGIKLDHEFKIEPGEVRELIMDFDAGRSIHRTGGGNYILVPVIRVMAVEASGSISGSVEPTFLQPIVSAVLGGQTITTTADVNGNFVLRPLPEGTYSVTLDASHMGLPPRTLLGVVVVAGQDTDLGRIMMGF